MRFFPLYIAKRYIFSRKSRNVINIISGISGFGVTIGTMALIVILSVFNGLDELISSLMNTFDPDLKISLKEGKTFPADSIDAEAVRSIEGVVTLTEVLEETAMLEYNEKQHIGRIKGVSDDFMIKNGIDSMMWQGTFKLKENTDDLAVVGYGVAYYLGIGLNFINPLYIYVPSRDASVMFNPEEAFNRKMIYPKGIFSIQNEYDSKYVFVSLDFAESLLEIDGKVTSLEVRYKDGLSQRRQEAIHEKVQTIAGDRFKVQNRRQQHEMLNKIMQSEKWMIFLILSFILFIASFNIIGSLTMLIIDKKDDIVTIRSLGAPPRMIRNIFLLEGWLISIIGAISGLILGAVICLLQLHFELIHFPASTIIDAYPVKMHIWDFVAVFGIVMVIGFLAAWYPVRFITRRYLKVIQK